jgi:5-methylcytosine-specific restriction endonuclease McrA
MNKRRNFDYLELFIMQKGLCFYCKKPMSHIKQEKNITWTKDHFKPKKNGNKLNGNVVLAHAECNRKKSDREPTKKEKQKFKYLYKMLRKRRKELKELKRVMK